MARTNRDHSPILLSSNLSTGRYTDSLHEDVKTDSFRDTTPYAFRRNVTLYPDRCSHCRHKLKTRMKAFGPFKVSEGLTAQRTVQHIHSTNTDKLYILMLYVSLVPLAMKLHQQLPHPSSRNIRPKFKL
jgi:hypothetical protein